LDDCALEYYRCQLATAGTLFFVRFFVVVVVVVFL
jgi:hypothetical protein